MSSIRIQDLHESVASGNESISEDQIINNRPSGSGNLAVGEQSAAPDKPPIVGKKRKAIQPRSDVWKHFVKIIDENGDEKAKCNYCDRLLACASKTSGTSSMRNHMNSCAAKRRKTESIQTELVLTEGSGLTSWKFDDAAMRKALALMIVLDELPFKFVEKEGFRNVLSVACPRFIIPSRWTAARDIFQRFQDERVLLKNQLKMSEQRICITTDTWTSNQQLSYMSLTAHYIDKNWILRKKILNFSPITSHKGESIGKGLEACLVEWGIEKIFTVTVDNASANDVAIDYLKRRIKSWGSGVVESKFIHMRCFAHILNLIVVDGLREPEVASAVGKIRVAVKHIKKSPQRLAKFKACIKRAKIDSKALLCLDVSTRWNSTYMMLAAAEKFEKAFDIYSVDDDNFSRDLLEAKLNPLEEEDWAIGRKLVKFLEKFYDLTNKISGTSYVTSNMFFREIILVARWFEEWYIDNDSLFISMVEKMKEKYAKYWGDPKKISMLIYIACVLDPRRRFKYIEFLIGESYQSDRRKGQELCIMVKESLTELYKWYENKSSPPLSSANDEVSSRDVTQSTSSANDEMEDKFYSTIGSDETLSDLDRYLNEEPKKNDNDTLNWWKVNSTRYPILSMMARDVLAVPVSTVASESAFSTGGRVLDDFRSSLSPSMVEALICSQNWLRKKKVLVEVEEGEEENQQFELEVVKKSIGAMTLVDAVEID